MIPLRIIFSISLPLAVLLSCVLCHVLSSTGEKNKFTEIKEEFVLKEVCSVPLKPSNMVSQGINVRTSALYFRSTASDFINSFSFYTKSYLLIILGSG